MSTPLLYSPRLWRYSTAIFLLRFVGLLFGLTLVMQMLDLLAQAETISENTANNESAIWSYVLLRFPQLADQFAPFVTLLAALLSFARLAQPSETIVMQAIGLSPMRIIAPILQCALLICLGHIIFRDTVVVPATTSLDAWKRNQYEGSPPVVDRRQGPFWFAKNNQHIRIAHIRETQSGFSLEDIKLIRIGAQDNRSGDILLARKATHKGGAVWQLAGVQTYDLDTYSWQKIKDISIDLGISQPDLQAAQYRLKHLPMSGLLEHAKIAGTASRHDQATQRLWQRITGPLAHVIMPLLGALVAFGTQRSGQLLGRMVAGLAIGFAYFVIENMFIAFGDFGLVSPFLAAFAPFLLFFAIAMSRLYFATLHSTASRVTQTNGGEDKS